MPSHRCMHVHARRNTYTARASKGSASCLPVRVAATGAAAGAAHWRARAAAHRAAAVTRRAPPALAQTSRCHHSRLHLSRNSLLCDRTAAGTCRRLYRLCSPGTYAGKKEASPDGGAGPASRHCKSRQTACQSLPISAYWHAIERSERREGRFTDFMLPAVRSATPKWVSLLSTIPRKFNLSPMR